MFRENSHIKEINRLKKQVANLQKRLREVELNFQFEIGVKKAHLLRVKNKENLSDDFILYNQSYLDLSPEQAFNIYNDLNRDYVLLDVSSKKYKPPGELPEAIKIPLNELEHNLHKLYGKGKSYLVISTNGVDSIKACKILNKHGYFNLSNISGGYQYWPEFKRIDHITDRSQAA